MVTSNGIRVISPAKKRRRTNSNRVGRRRSGVRCSGESEEDCGVGDKVVSVGSVRGGENRTGSVALEGGTACHAGKPIMAVGCKRASARQALGGPRVRRRNSRSK